MTVSFWDETSSDLCTLKNLMPQLCGWIFASNPPAKRETDLYVVYMLRFCEKNKKFFTELGMFLDSIVFDFQPLEREIIFGFGPENWYSTRKHFLSKIKSNIRRSANGGISPRKSGMRLYFSTKPRYPPLFCFEQVSTFFFSSAYAPLSLNNSAQKFGSGSHVSNCFLQATKEIDLHLTQQTQRRIGINLEIDPGIFPHL